VLGFWLSCGGSTGATDPGSYVPPDYGPVTGLDVQYDAATDRGLDASPDVPADLPLPDPGVPVEDVPVPPDPGFDPGQPEDPGVFDPGTANDPGIPEDPGVQPDPGDDATPECSGCKVGNVKGLTCAPNIKTAVSYVKVWVDTVNCKGEIVHIETYSNAKGEYVLVNVPCGPQTIQMQKGSFYHKFTRVVVPGQTVGGTSTDQCFLGNVAKLAVVTGDWDMIQWTLDYLHLKYKTYNGNSSEYGTPTEAVNLLSNASKLSEYDVVFINCSDSAGPIMASNGAEISAALQQFVQGGGSLYLSDYAHPYFEQTWPGYVLFPASPHSVPGNQTLDGHVLDSDLAAYLAKDHVAIHYGLGPLTAATGVGPDTTVFIEAFFKDPGATWPLMTSFQPYPGGGHVIYTTFHNDEQSQIQADMGSILQYVVFLL
jgi:hypothetical protein